MAKDTLKRQSARERKIHSILLLFQGLLSKLVRGRVFLFRFTSAIAEFVLYIAAAPD
jgi:hypothetical protein